jgi:hypothetical protein
MHGVSRPNKKIGGRRNHQDAAPAQQRFVDNRELPQTSPHVIREAHREIARLTGGQQPFAKPAMNERCVIPLMPITTSG